MNHYPPIAVVCFLAAMAVAQDRKPPAPKLTVAMPLCIKPGETTKFTVRGANLDTVTDLRVHEPKSRGKIVTKGKKVGVPNNFPAERIGDSEMEIEIVAAKEIGGATLSFSVIGPGGESNVAKIAVDDGVHRVLEKEPNDGFDKAQLIDFPITVDGTIDRVQDSDVYQFRGKAGETIRIEVQAAKLGSPADLMMTLYDSEKRILDSNDDAGVSADPMLKITLPKDGTYYISLIEMHDLGGKMFPYRLVLTVWETSGVVTINGQDSRVRNAPDGFDTVQVGFLGSVRRIRNDLIVTNDGAYSKLTVNNSRDTDARTGILYRNGSNTVLNGLTPSADIVMRTRDLGALTILASNSNNTFRIHDTPTIRPAKPRIRSTSGVTRRRESSVSTSRRGPGTTPLTSVAPPTGSPASVSSPSTARPAPTP